MAATEGVLKSVCMYCCDSEIDRRPYHRNCSCALHRSRRSGDTKSGKNCSHGLPKSKTISYPMRKSWSEGCLSLASAAGTGSSADSSPAGSPAIGPPATIRSLHRRLSSFDEVEEDQSLGGGGVFFKI